MSSLFVMSLTAAVQSMLKLITIYAVGIFSAHTGLLNAQLVPQVSNFNFNVASPALILANLTRNIELERLKIYWPVVFWCLITTGLGTVIGMLFCKIFRIRNEFVTSLVTSVSYSNSSTLTLIIMQTLVPTSIFSSDPITAANAYNTVLSLVFTWSIGWNITFYSMAYPYLLELKPDPEAEAKSEIITQNDLVKSEEEEESQSINHLGSTDIEQSQPPKPVYDLSVDIDDDPRYPSSPLMVFCGTFSRYGNSLCDVMGRAITKFFLRKLPASVRFTIVMMFTNPPFIAIVIAIVTGLTPPLKRPFFDNDGPLHFIVAAIDFVSALSIPLGALVTAANIYFSLIKNFGRDARILRRFIDKIHYDQDHGIQDDSVMLVADRHTLAVATSQPQASPGLNAPRQSSSLTPLILSQKAPLTSPRVSLNLPTNHPHNLTINTGHSPAFPPQGTPLHTSQSRLTQVASPTYMIRTGSTLPHNMSILRHNSVLQPTQSQANFNRNSSLIANHYNFSLIPQDHSIVVQPHQQYVQNNAMVYNQSSLVHAYIQSHHMVRDTSLITPISPFIVPPTSGDLSALGNDDLGYLARTHSLLRPRRTITVTAPEQPPMNPSNDINSHSAETQYQQYQTTPYIGATPFHLDAKLPTIPHSPNEDIDEEPDNYENNTDHNALVEQEAEPNQDNLGSDPANRIIDPTLPVDYDEDGKILPLPRLSWIEMIMVSLMRLVAVPASIFGMFMLVDLLGLTFFLPKDVLFRTTVLLMSASVSAESVLTVNIKALRIRQGMMISLVMVIQTILCLITVPVWIVLVISYSQYIVRGN